MSNIYSRRWRRGPRYQARGADVVLRVVSLLLFAWLIVGAFAAWQRGYITHPTDNCGSSDAIAVTVIAGPMNYLGVNSKAGDCHLPSPTP